MEILVGILAFMVATLSVLQGWQMVKKRNSNPNSVVKKLDDISVKLDTIVTQLGRMEQRLNDIWEKK